MFALLSVIGTAHASVITLPLRSSQVEGDTEICIYANAIQTNTLEIEVDYDCPSNHLFTSAE